MSNNDKKFKLLLGMIIAIIVVLVIGIVYQFVCIKKLENKINDLNSQKSYIEIPYEKYK